MSERWNKVYNLLCWGGIIAAVAVLAFCPPPRRHKSPPKTPASFDSAADSGFDYAPTNGEYVLIWQQDAGDIIRSRRLDPSQPASVTNMVLTFTMEPVVTKSADVWQVTLKPKARKP